MGDYIEHGVHLAVLRVLLLDSLVAPDPAVFLFVLLYDIPRPIRRAVVGYKYFDIPVFLGYHTLEEGGKVFLLIPRRYDYRYKWTLGKFMLLSLAVDYMETYCIE